MSARRFYTGMISLLIAIAVAACDRSPTKPIPASRPTTRGGGGTPQYLVMTTRPAGKPATSPPSYDAVDLMAPPDIVAQIRDRIGFDPFGETAIQLHDLGGRPKLAIVGPIKLNGGEYAIDVEEMGQTRTSTHREFSGWINLKSRDVPEECRTFVQVKWDQASTTAPTSVPVRMEAPITATVLWIGPKMTDKTTSRIGVKPVPPITSEGAPVTPDRTRPPASSGVPSPPI